MRALFFLMTVFMASPLLAQYDGPAVETCRAYAKREMAREGNRAKDVIFERDTNLAIERYTRKVGNQFVSSILRGNGAVVLDNAPSAELAFICLLADDKRAVFFEWLPRPHASALAQCTRDSTVREKPRPCLELLLQIAESDLMTASAHRFQDARERDHGSGNESAAMRFRASNDGWKQYRDAECARRREHAPQGIAPEDYQLACMVDLTRRRSLDVR